MTEGNKLFNPSVIWGNDGNDNLISNVGREQ